MMLATLSLFALLAFFLLFGWVLWSIAAMVVGGMIALRRRRLNQLALLNLLATAAKANVPLSPALEAFARECSSRYGREVRRLATLLAQGRSLDEALGYARGLLPAEHRVLARVGMKSSQLGPALQEAATAQAAVEPIRQTAEVHLLYVAWVCLGLAGISSFLFLKIGPRHILILREFGVSSVVAAAMQELDDPWIDWAWAGLAGLVVGASLLLAAWRYLLPLLLTRRLDTAATLRTLALCTSARAPIDVGIRGIAALHPRWHIRRRARMLLKRLAAGCDWARELGRCRLIRRAEAAVLRTVADPAHLAWTMRELAGSAERRHLYRRRMFVEIAFPLTLAALGGFVFLIVILFMLPLIEIIESQT
jgi:type II secretory pathway component PulF